jgi:Domain of unknown function (DUF4282)
MSNDPAPGGEQQPGWHGQQPYPGGYGQQQPEQPTYASYPPPPAQPAGYGQAAQPTWQQQTPGQQQRYPGYPAGTTGIPPQNEAPSFFGALFDFGFNSFATPVVIKVLYILSMVAIGLSYVIALVFLFLDDPTAGLIFVVVGGVLALLALIYTRVLLELLYAGVRIAEDIRVLRNRQ